MGRILFSFNFFSQFYFKKKNSRTLPPTQPDKRIYNGHLFQLFRRDFVVGYPKVCVLFGSVWFGLALFKSLFSQKKKKKPLCPDAFTSFIIHDEKMTDYNEDIVDATNYLKNDGFFHSLFPSSRFILILILILIWFFFFSHSKLFQRMVVHNSRS